MEVLVAVYDRMLQHGRITRTKPNANFELFLFLSGKQTRIAEVTTEEEAIGFYEKTINILKPALHSPFTQPDNNSVQEDQVNRLAMFDDLSSYRDDAFLGATSTTTGSSSSSTTTSSSSSVNDSIPKGDGERKIALKTLAAPAEDLNSRRRKLISQVNLSLVYLFSYSVCELYTSCLLSFSFFLIQAKKN
jgi:hypothetical protein